MAYRTLTTTATETNIIRALMVLLIAATMSFAGKHVAPNILGEDAERRIGSTLRKEIAEFLKDVRDHGISNARRAYIERPDHPFVQVDESGRVLVSVSLVRFDKSVGAEITALGLDVLFASEKWNRAEGWAAPEAIISLASHPVVRMIRPIARPMTSSGYAILGTPVVHQASTKYETDERDSDVRTDMFTDRAEDLASTLSAHPKDQPILNIGSVTSEGVAIHRADIVHALGYDGTGVRVGVISDGVDNLAAAQATGDLPSHVAVIPGFAGSDDKGTAMLEIVHDVAPGAELYFASALGGQLSFVEAIRQLAAAGCHVIVDDITYLAEPTFEDGPIAQVIDSVNAEGIAYYSAAGNQVQRHYSALYAAGPGSWHAWDGVGDIALAVTVPAYSQFIAFLTWNDPFGASNNDYDLALSISPDFHPNNIIAYGGDWQTGEGDPLEFVGIYSNNPNPITLYLGVLRYAGITRMLKLFMFGATSLEYSTTSGSLWGHSNATGAIATGAIHADDPGHMEIASYSSHGPAEIYFPARETRLKPDIIGISGVHVTGAGGFPSPFYGTSASAPHLAGLAALAIGGSRKRSTPR